MNEPQDTAPQEQRIHSAISARGGGFELVFTAEKEDAAGRAKKYVLGRVGCRDRDLLESIEAACDRAIREHQASAEAFWAPGGVKP